MLAGFLILIMVLCLAWLGLSVLRGTQKGSDTSAAQVAAEHILNAFLEEMRKTTPIATSFWSGSTFSRPGHFQMNHTDFAYQLDAVTVTDSSGTPLGGGVPGNGVKQIQLKLNWWDSSQTSGQRQGYGKLEYSVTRLFSQGGRLP